MTILFRLLAAAASGTAAMLAYRHFFRREAGPVEAVTDEEPVLGYDGMDLGTLLPWLESAHLDRETLQRVRAYELAHRNRESVLGRVDELLG